MSSEQIKPQASPGQFFILGEDGRTPVEADCLEWARWLHAKRNERIVAKTEIRPGVSVSTVFLGINERIGPGAPVLFETLVFGGECDGEMWRYGTWAQAEKGHAQAVVLVKERQP